MVTHISLDLETWGTRPGADIRSIGACVFEPATGRIGFGTNHEDNGTFYIACDNPLLNGSFGWDDGTGARRRYNLHRDPRTVQWWSEQSDEAQTAFADPVDLREALERFDAWLQSVAGRGHYSPANQYVTNVCIWSHGAAFDPPILAGAYHAVGLPVPWHYRAPRDTRTLFDMVGIDDHTAWLKQHPGPLGLVHHALDDSICQARAVCAAYGRIGAALLEAVGNRPRNSATGAPMSPREAFESECG